MKGFFDSGNGVEDENNALFATLDLLLFLLDMASAALHDAIHQLLALFEAIMTVCTIRPEGQLVLCCFSRFSGLSVTPHL